MSQTAEEFRAAYAEAFGTHLERGGEAGLRAAYELGRTAMHSGLNVLDLAALHHEVLFATLVEAADAQVLVEAGERSSTFFLEVLSTFEMVQRGVVEAHETARLEQRHAEQLRRLADASIAISSAGTLDEIAERIPEHAVRVLGAAASSVAVQTAEADPIVGAHPPGSEPDPEHTRRTAVLLRRNGSSLGLLEVVLDGVQPFGANEESILTQLARVAAVALENVELYEQERLVAETLQRRLLPGALPTFHAAETAWRYLPGWGGSDIGGDWYDAMVLPDDRLALAVGDVMGKGIRAAAGMGQLRIALRAYAIEGHPPAGVMRWLDEIVEELEEELATAVYLVYDPDGGVLTYANAGHPPPLLIRPGGAVRTLREGLSPPLGCILGGEVLEGRTEVEPGSVLVVYTDGLVERRDSDLEHGIGRLEEVAASGDPTDLEAFCDLLLRGMDAEHRGDDIALLVTRLGVGG